MDRNDKVSKEHHPSTQRLLKSSDTALTKCLSLVEPEEFTDAYKAVFATAKFKSLDSSTRPPLAGSTTEAKNLREKLRKSAIEYLKDDMNQFVEDEKLDQHFFLLDSLKRDLHQLPDTSKAWRPPGNAKEHMRQKKITLKLKEKKELTTRVAVEREKLETLMKRVKGKRQHIEGLRADMRSKSRSLEKFTNGSLETPK